MQRRPPQSLQERAARPQVALSRAQRVGSRGLEASEVIDGAHDHRSMHPRPTNTLVPQQQQQQQVRKKTVVARSARAGAMAVKALRPETATALVGEENMIPNEQCESTRAIAMEEETLNNDPQTFHQSLPVDSTVNHLRTWTTDALHQHLYQAACFWGELLLFLSHDSADDALLLAHAYYSTKQYSRVIALFGKEKKLSDARCRNILAQCLMNLERYEEALSCLEEESCLESSNILGYPSMSASRGILTSASAHYRKGEAQYRLGHIANARRSFIQALQADCRCYDAFHTLISGQMLSVSEEQKLVDGLNFELGGSLSRVVKLLYIIRLRKIGGDLHTQKSAVTLLETEFRLGGFSYLTLCHAEIEFSRYRFETSLQLTTKIIEYDPLNLDCMILHVSNLYHMKKKNVIFLLAHELVDKHPTNAISWYAVGCYYMLCGKYAAARSNFSKATSLDRACSAAWLAFAHSLHADSEDKQAADAYSEVLAVSKGAHQPLIYMAMQYMKAGKTIVAESYLKSAKELCPIDPLLESEYGAICYKDRRFDDAVRHFQRALDLGCDDLLRQNSFWLGTRGNLGHALRRLGRLDEARDCFKQLITAASSNADSFVALGMMDISEGKVESAIDHYHTALSLEPESEYISQLFTDALEQSVRTPKLISDVSLSKPIFVSERMKRRSNGMLYSQNSGEPVDGQSDVDGTKTDPAFEGTAVNTLVALSSERQGGDAVRSGAVPTRPENLELQAPLAPTPKRKGLTRAVDATDSVASRLRSRARGAMEGTAPPGNSAALPLNSLRTGPETTDDIKNDGEEDMDLDD